MGFLAAAIPAVASLAGSIIGGNAQKHAAQAAADAQLSLQQQQVQATQQQEADYRAQIQKMLPYLQGPTQVASQLHNQNHYLAPGQNQGMFGGQQLGSNGSPVNQFQGFENGMATHMPLNTNYLAQAMQQGTSGVPAFIPPQQQVTSGLTTFPGISGSGAQINWAQPGQRQLQGGQRLPGIG
jgi:hypothetical protein